MKKMFFAVALLLATPIHAAAPSDSYTATTAQAALSSAKQRLTAFKQNTALQRRLLAGLLVTGVSAACIYAATTSNGAIAQPDDSLLSPSTAPTPSTSPAASATPSPSASLSPLSSGVFSVLYNNIVTNLAYLNSLMSFKQIPDAIIAISAAALIKPVGRGVRACTRVTLDCAEIIRILTLLALGKQV